jgi:(1->4)-alpha-D-glucan 1-alpha-D-glucosylmutase
MTPRSTARLQLTREFTFDDARSRVDYFAALGISHFYLSPIFRAREGSTHGYDAVDFSKVSDALGGMDGLRRLIAALRARGMGAILDIVPNHMGVAGKNNAWWNDVLANGRDSDYARHFDIDWMPEQRSLQGKVLLPYLDRPLPDALDAGLLKVVRENDAWKVAHYDSRWPLSGESISESMSAAELGELLERQHYRLDDWRVAPERINWRRFFDIAELAALRIEDERVFQDVHRTVFALYEEGLIDGVRVDHVDGLSYPIQYCQKLRDELDARRAKRPAELRDAPPYIVVEKIFASHEPQRDWGVAGTTGYDFMDQVAALLHNPAGQGTLDVLWRRVSGRPWEFRGAVSDARRQILSDSFNADLSRVARSLHALATQTNDSAHLTYASIKRALVELVVAFPVYRCYGMPGALPPEDAAILAFAVERTTRELKPEDYAALDFISRALRDLLDESLRSAQSDVAVRFQQLTAPIAAKAIEDTVFYREVRLLSRNEVGSDPNAFSLGIDEFHSVCSARFRRFPNSLLATATHDHKRGEDARMRLATISDDAERWAESVSRWMEMNVTHKRMLGGSAAPDAVDEFMLYQTLVGAWPLDGNRENLRERVGQWWTKALRESKRHTSWIAPNAAYEESCMNFLDAALGNEAFANDVAGYVETIAPAAALGSLTQTFLRLTTPGVPDLYQGCEFWDFSLVDPDNRRRVDFDARITSLARGESPADALREWSSGVVKQQLIARVLHHRAEWPAVYASGDYLPLTISGLRSAHTIAFERRLEGARIVCIASRWALSLAGGTLSQPLIDAPTWDDAAIALDDGKFVDVLNGGEITATGGALPVAAALARFPVALLFSRG